MYDKFKSVIDQAQHVLVIQAENPDGDSLGSALALEDILEEMGKQVTLYCSVEMPKYLRYTQGWDRVTTEWPKQFDAAIIVDTASELLIERALIPEQLAALKKVPVIVLDHHKTESTLDFEVTAIVDATCVATGELLYRIAEDLTWPVTPQAAENIMIAIMADSLGLTTPNK